MLAKGPRKGAAEMSLPGGLLMLLFCELPVQHACCERSICSWLRLPVAAMPGDGCEELKQEAGSHHFAQLPAAAGAWMEKVPAKI